MPPEDEDKKFKCEECGCEMDEDIDLCEVCNTGYDFDDPWLV